MPAIRSNMPSRQTYLEKLHQATVQNEGVVDFDFLKKYGGNQLHFKGCDFNPNANIVTHRIVDSTYDNNLATDEIEMMHIPVYKKIKTDKQGRTITRTYNLPRPPPYPETGANAPTHLAFLKLPYKKNGHTQYKLLGVCELMGPPTIFRPQTVEHAQRLYPYHLRKHGKAVLASTLEHDQQRSRYRVTPF